MSKPRSDSVLKNLPEERQAQIVEWCDTPKSESCPGGYHFARLQLAADGLNVSLRALSDFWSWWNLGKDIKAAADVEALMLEANPAAVKEARESGELLFLKLSMARQDYKAFATAAGAADSRRALDLKEQIEPKKLELIERRVKLLEDNASKAKEQLEAVKRTGGLSPEALAQIEEAAKLL